MLVSAAGVRAGETYTLAVGSTSTSVTMDSITYSNVKGMGGLGGGPGGAPGGPGDLGTPPGAPDGRPGVNG